MWAVWAFRRLDSLHIGPLGDFSDDVGVSFTVLWVLLSLDDLAHGQRKTWCESIKQMCEGSTSRIVLRYFQLESLILAQNERWRQA